MMELDWLKQWNQFSPDAIALEDGDTGRKISYGEFYRKACLCAKFLADQYKVSRGDRVALLATNELETVILFFATQRLGAILVPINFRLTSPEIEHIISDSQPRVLLVQDEFAGTVEKISSAARPQEIIPYSQIANWCATPESTSRTPFEAQEADPCMIIYTSGTTGAPKGALLTHRMLFWNSVNTTLRLNVSQNDAAVIFLPFFHTGGWNVLTTPFLHRGARLIFVKKFDADQILTLTEKEQCSLIFGVPTTMEMMARSEVFKKVSLKSVRYAIVGGEPMPLEAIHTWHEKGIPIRQGYGLTEFGPNVFSLNEQDAIRKIGSIGFPNFYVEAKVVGDHGEELAADQIGELALRGPMAMEGYWKNPKATQETLREGWLFTGDLVRRDQEGYFYVVGRKKDMFKSGGENVYPAELEKVLRSFQGVREAAVIGVPDDKWGEVGQAYLVLDNQAITEGELRAYCVDRLAKFKIPKYFTFLPQLPKGDSGKILKKSLRELGPTPRH